MVFWCIWGGAASTRGQMTIDEHMLGLERHLRILQGMSPISINLYRLNLKYFAVWLRETRGSDDPTGVQRKDIENYLEYCYYQGNQVATRSLRLVAIRRLFRYLQYEGYVQEDPTALIPRPRVPKSFVPVFSKEEVIRLFRTCDITQPMGLRDVCILILAAFAGLRMHEITSLNLWDVLDDGKNVDINIIRSKRAGSRIVYLWKAPSLLLREWYMHRMSQGARPEDPLFVSLMHMRKGKYLPRMSDARINAMFKVRVARAQIRRRQTYLHMLRATHAENLRQVAGYDTPAIAERLGHSSIATTDRYLPRRGRIHRTYRSLAAFWSEFPRIWSEGGKTTDDPATQPMGDARNAPE